MSRFIAATLGLSIVGHALFLGFGAPRKHELPPMAERGVSTIFTNATENLGRMQHIHALRQALITDARAARQNGTLLLGRFLLETNRIDAEEDGQIFEYDDALDQYDKRLSDLREALRKEKFVVYAAPYTFGDLRYYGHPGGRMGDALIDGGGSCEQVAQLVVAAAFDIGRAKEVSFRAYGQSRSDGGAHLAPISKHDGIEYDLMRGSPAAPGGVRVAPDELVEIYARLHGLAPPIEHAAATALRGAKTGFGAQGAAEQQASVSVDPGRKSFALGFPPNNDVYPGRLPFYAEHAIKSPLLADPKEGGLDDPEMAVEQARHCAYFLRMASLSPLMIDVFFDERGSSDVVSLEAVRVPNTARLDREAALIRAAEDLATNRSVDDADHLLGFACLAAVGEVAATDFSLAGQRRLATFALEAGQRAREGGNKLLADIHWKTPDGIELARRLRVDYAGRSWLLLFLEGGDKVVLDLTRQSDADDWGRVSSAAALLVFPDTRNRAFEIITKFSRREQVDIMHEIFHAHDHLRPWATNYEFELPADASPAALSFLRMYRVFRALAFRLWEGQREPGETVDAFLLEAKEAELDSAWQAAMIDYYSRNVLGLYSQRNKGLQIMVALDRAIQANPHPSLDPLRRQIAFIKAEGKLDARTLADAFRQK